MKDFLKIAAILLVAGLVMAVTVTRPNWHLQDAFVVTCAVGATSFPSVTAKHLQISVRSTATNPVWIGPDGGTAVGDGLQLSDSFLGFVPVDVNKNANELDCIRDGAGDVDLTVIAYR